MKDLSKLATWELEAMKKARTFLSALNTPEEEAELQAIRKELTARKKAVAKSKRK